MKQGLIFAVIAFSAAFILNPAFAAGGEPEIRASVDKKVVFIGDRIRFTIEARADKELDVAFPKPQNGRIGDFEIKDYKVKTKKTLFGKAIKSCVYELTTYSAGKYIIPPVEIKYKEKSVSGDWSLAKTPTIGVNVESVLPKNTKIYDIKDIKGPLSFYSPKAWIAAPALLISILAITAIIVYLKRGRKRKVRPAHEVALEELDAVRQRFLTGGGIKEYHIAISDSVRRYIEARFSLRAPEMTTEEFLGSLKELDSLVAGHKDSLNNFLKACDLVKFARYEPTPAETEAVFNTAAKFIEETKEPENPDEHPK